jgi:hypothetical protein
MKKLSVVLTIAAALVLLLGRASEAGRVPAGPLPNKPAKPNNTVAAAAGTQYLTIPATAFTPYEDGYDFLNAGPYLVHYHSPGGGTGNGWYLAPVQLPQGATVTEMTFHFFDDSTTNNILAQLQRSDLAGGFYEMATVDSAGYSAGYSNRSDTSITSPVIDNLQNSYWVIWDGPVYGGTGLDASGVSVVIAYTPPATDAGVISLSAAAFTPYVDGYDFQNHGRYLMHYHSPGGGTANGWYLAPVQLPQGATVTTMIFQFFDDSTTNNILARLWRSDLAGGSYEMATVDSAGYSVGYGKRADMTISNPVIDNLHNSYWVVWDGSAYGGTGYDASGVSMVIEYTPPATDARILSIPAAAFAPYEDGYDFQNEGPYLMHYHSPDSGTANGWYLAPVQLPQGVTVAKMTFHFFDDSTTNNIVARLQRSDLAGSSYEMATVDSTGYSAGYSNRSDTTIDSPVIDNLHNSYWVLWDGPVYAGTGYDASGVSVVIECNFRVYLPAVLKNY